jgi:hypothetical protein
MNKTMTLETVHDALHKVLDYMWKDEQTSWEVLRFPKTFPEDQPLEGDEHIFKYMVLLNEYLAIMEGKTKSAIVAQEDFKDMPFLKGE